MNAGRTGVIFLAVAIVGVASWSYWAASVSDAPKGLTQTAAKQTPTNAPSFELNSPPPSISPAEKSALIEEGPPPGGALATPADRFAAGPSEEMLKRLSKDVQSRVFNDLSGGAFFKALSDVKRKEVLDALSKAEIARMNLMHEGMMKRQPPSRQQMDQIKKDADESVRAIVGEAAYSEYQSYMSNQPHRMVVNLMNEGLNEPLDGQTSEVLIQILAEEARKLGATQGSTQDPELARAGMMGMADRAVQRAADHLNPDQVQALRGSFDRLLSREKPRR